MAVSKAKMELLNWRRQKVYDLLVAGYNQTEIADILKVSDHTVISRDVSHIRAQATFSFCFIEFFIRLFFRSSNIFLFSFLIFKTI